MNRHFQRDHPRDWKPPARVFAKLDHIEPAGVGSSVVLLAFDAVDADWIARRGTLDERFDLNDPDRALAALARQPLRPLLRGQGLSLFDDALLVRIEVEHQLGTSLFDYPGFPDFVDTGRADSGLAALEATWFDIGLNLPIGGGIQAQVYPGLFAQPVTSYVKGTMPSVKQGQVLSGIFSLSSLPGITTPQLETTLSVCRADLLAVYDVGQGNSNALLESNGPNASPTLYFDLGAGVYRNQRTTPNPLVFCFSHAPPIVLSHWDADHWAGAYANSVGGHYPALTQAWYAPMQTPGPVHIAFAHDVISQGGSVSTYAPVAGTVGSALLSTGQVLRFALGSGTDRNNTGIVVAVEDDSLAPPRSWVMTGDCDYGFFLSRLAPLPPVGLVAPHHGASLASGTHAPRPVALSNGYNRLAYSFGAGNRHGKSTQHPTATGMSLHSTPGWNHGAWAPATPGLCVAGANVLETEIHGAGGTPPSPLGGCLVGWSAVPSTVSPPCGGTNCTISPVRA